MIFDGILCDAAFFPPGSAPAEVAVRSHFAHRQSPQRRYLGPFVAPASSAISVADLSAKASTDPLELTLTFSGDFDALANTILLTNRLEGIRITAVDVAIPDHMGVSEALSALSPAIPKSIQTFVEVPRDHRRETMIAALAGNGMSAKLRTGGTIKDAYPSESELAQTIYLAATSNLPFKATAGLHHAVRNTDIATGFEQHGFLNMMSAVGAAIDGAGPADLVRILRCRDEEAMSEAISALTPQQAAGIRHHFLSFGTCSILEPLQDLIRLQLIAADDVATASERVQL
ncbi:MULTISPECIES: hypothetical protein [unclassified Mycolicibacterium]|uniref:hypothetical protein n=1 Tax=unclassified Mycolicibacterium TaxID=2636767 RepID=UPI002ED88DFB